MTDPADSHAHEDEARVAATAKAFRARSRRVQLLRRVLPVAIIILAGGTVSWIVLRSVMSDVERKAGTSREIRLDTLRFHGQDAAGRSFVIGAEGAVRDPDTGRYRLIGPALTSFGLVGALADPVLGQLYRQLMPQQPPIGTGQTVYEVQQLILALLPSGRAKLGQIADLMKNRQVGIVKEIKGKNAVVQLGAIPITVSLNDLVVVVDKVEETETK